jgi:methionyl-tRNA formyltransferase
MPQKKLNIIFMGTPLFAVPHLKTLVASQEKISGVITKSSRPSGRGRKVTPPPVKVIAESFKLPVHQPDNIKDKGIIKWISEINPDVIVVSAYGKKIPEEILSLPHYGCINVHPSLLPRYRGPAPINWAILNGDETTGVTIMKMDSGIDTGDILLQEEISVDPEEDAGSLEKRLSELGGELLKKAISGIKKNTVQSMPQQKDGISFAPALKKEDGIIDWSKRANEIKNQILGFSPNPGAYTKLEKKLLKIFRAEVHGKAGEGLPGKIREIGKKGFNVITGDKCLFITEIQLENKRKMRVEEFLRGHKIKPGTILGK